jgi:MinD superfamily P-loop ATPase
MVHARLGIAAENSGKLVSVLRQEARRLAAERGNPLILVDGPPGIGCPVIASMTGAAAVLIVTEPTLSGEHDLKRVLDLARHFGIGALVCVNRWDINPAMAERIEQEAEKAGATTLPRIPYDRSVTDAQVKGVSIVEHNDGPAAQSIRQIWEEIRWTVS